MHNTKWFPNNCSGGLEVLFGWTEDQLFESGMPESSFCVCVCVCCVLCKQTHWAVDNDQNAATRYCNHWEKRYAIIRNYFYLRVRRGAVGWGYKPKVARSIPDWVTGSFYLLNCSGHTTTLVSTQPLAEMSNRGTFCEVRRADNLATFMWRLSRNSGSFKLLELQGFIQVCVRIALLTVSTE